MPNGHCYLHRAVSAHGLAGLYFEPLMLLNFDCNKDPAFHSNADLNPDPVSKNIADLCGWIRIRKNTLFIMLFDCLFRLTKREVRQLLPQLV
jgi:hypothetical protein